MNNIQLAKDHLIKRLEKLIMPEPNTGCWLWIGDSVKGGYGRCVLERKKWLIHRLMFTAFKTEIKDGLTIDHLCKQPSCCNPDHLEQVTMKENTMRGNSFSKVNALKTHCPQGHEYSKENTYWYKNPKRRGCKICINKKSLERYHKRNYEY